jgi:DNA invertase Pin-like site-specific DNA recombinase
MSQKIGYIRVSSKNQNLDRQLEVMRKHKVEKVFQEKKYFKRKCLLKTQIENN